MVPVLPWPHCAEPGETVRTGRASEVTSATGQPEGTAVVRDGAGGALMNSGGIDDGGRSKKPMSVVAVSLAMLAGLVVVGGGIALFVSALFG